MNSQADEKKPVEVFRAEDFPLLEAVGDQVLAAQNAEYRIAALAKAMEDFLAWLDSPEREGLPQPTAAKRLRAAWRELRKVPK